MTTLHLQSPANIARMWQRFRRSRAYLFVLVGLIAMLVGTVAIGQSSQNYDLACRSVMSGGGGTITGGVYGVIAAFGMPIVPPLDTAPPTPPTYSIRGGNYAIRAGFLPGYPTGIVTSATADSPGLTEQFTNVVRLPIIEKMGLIVRGGC